MRRIRRCGIKISRGVGADRTAEDVESWGREGNVARGGCYGGCNFCRSLNP